MVGQNGSISSPLVQVERFPDANYDMANNSPGAEEMERMGSGGLRVGDTIIAFGDFPEPVDVSAARSRAETYRRSAGGRRRGRNSISGRERGFSNPDPPTGLGFESEMTGH